MINVRLLASLGVLLMLFGCASSGEDNSPLTIGVYSIWQPQALEVLDTNAQIETLADGFKWTEGPVWVESEQKLLFSDIPANKVYAYSETQGLSVYLDNSGYSNGLLVNAQQQLVLLQSRSRKVVTMDANLAQPKPKYQVLASHYQAAQLNSPNDGVIAADGSLYFTDPPYGLPKLMDDPNKELPFQGVYRLSPQGTLTLLDDQLSYPNGIALSEDQKTLYVAVSDKQAPAWYTYDLSKGQTSLTAELWHRPTPADTSASGLPDGLKIHKSGLIFATGPGGVWIFDKSGQLMAKIKTPSVTANLAFNARQDRLYITAHDRLLAINLKGNRDEK